MINYILTALVLLIGFVILSTGFIKVLFVLWLTYLLILVVFAILGYIWASFQIQNDK